MEPERRRRAFAAVERVTEFPMLVLALLMIPLLVIPWAFDLPGAWEAGLIGGEWFIWAAFALELVVKTYLAPDRKRYLLTHWIDVLIVLIPFLRPLRIVRSARVLRLLRLLRLVVFLSAFLSRSGISTRRLFGRHGLHYTLAGSLLIVVVVAALVAMVEAGAEGRSITNFSTSLWWGATTVTTVGYGDTAPVTAAGRGLGVMLMLVGIGVFGVLTANVAAFFVESSVTENPAPAGGNAELERLSAEVRGLHDRIVQLQESLIGAPGGERPSG